jgi:hypothetical protein
MRKVVEVQDLGASAHKAILPEVGSWIQEKSVVSVERKPSSLVESQIKNIDKGIKDIIKDAKVRRASGTKKLNETEIAA